MDVLIVGVFLGMQSKEKIKYTREMRLNILIKKIKLIAKISIMYWVFYFEPAALSMDNLQETQPFLKNIKFKVLTKEEVAEKIKEIKTVKINNTKYTIFRLLNGGKVVTRGEGEFLVAGETYKVYLEKGITIVEDIHGLRIYSGDEK